MYCWSPPSAKQSMIALNRQISQLCLQFKQQQTSIVQVVELCRIHNYFDWMDCPIFHRYQIVVLTNKSICEKKVAFMRQLFKATRAGQTCKFLTQSLFDLRSHKAVFYRHYPSQRAINGRRLNIPYICHFFTRAKFLDNKIYTEKRQFFALNL